MNEHRNNFLNHNFPNNRNNRNNFPNNRNFRNDFLNNIDNIPNLQLVDNIDGKINIRMVGGFRSLTGYGFAARNYARQLMELPNVNLHLKNINVGIDNIKDDDIKDFLEYFNKISNNYDFEIIVSYPTPNHLSNKSKNVIWCFYWESSVLPIKWVNFLNSHPNHMIVNPSCYMKRILDSNDLQNSFYKVRHWHKRIEKSNIKNKETIFYTIAQDVHRKNLEQLIDAFSEEFYNDNSVKLRMKISKHMRSLDIIQNYIESKNTSNIEIITGTLSEKQIEDIHSTGDIFVLAQHSEGYGLPHMDALITGNLLVTTDYGSISDYLNDSNAFLIPYKEDFIERTNRYDRDALNFYPEGGKWAIIEKDDIKKKLREALNNKNNIKTDFIELSLKDTAIDWNILFENEYFNKKSTL